MLALLVNLLIILIVLGLVYWIAMQIPMPPPFRTAVNVVLALIAIVFLLGMIGIVPGWHWTPHRF